MIPAEKLRSIYNVLYSQLRNYKWPIYTVQLISKLEVECYSAFPNLDEISHVASLLKRDVLSRRNIDVEELKNTFSVLEDTLNNNEEVYLPISKYTEVI